MISEFLEETIIAVVSLSVGYAVGRYRRQATMGRPQRERLLDIGRTVLGLIAVVAVGLTVYQVQANTAHDREVAQCLTAYAVNQAERINERSGANGERDRQLVAVVDAVLDPGSTPHDRAAALRSFRDAVATAERSRAAAPLLGPPRCEP